LPDEILVFDYLGKEKKSDEKEAAAKN